MGDEMNFIETIEMAMDENGVWVPKGNIILEAKHGGVIINLPLKNYRENLEDSHLGEIGNNINIKV